MTQDVLTELRGHLGCITLNRPKSLNALNLDMIRILTVCLLAWQKDDMVQAVAVRGSSKAGFFGAFCAGGDIRFFHQSLLTGDPKAEDFFTEEYILNHLIHHYPKPIIAFMDGVVMGGGMGISQGASHRLVTVNTQMAMPETAIGLFPDVGGGYFLSRCPGFAGEWLALTGSTLNAAQAIALGLADHAVNPADLASIWNALANLEHCDRAHIDAVLNTFYIAISQDSVLDRAKIDNFFSRDCVTDMVHALVADSSAWAQRTAVQLRQRSPLMLHVALAQIRHARHLSLAQDLRMERDLMRHCFFPEHLQRRASQTEVAEGIRARVIDKDNAPRWQPACIEAVSDDMVQPFFGSCWPAHSHPLRNL